MHSRYQEVVAPYQDAPESLEPGCVRLLSSRVLPGIDRPVYVLVLAEWEQDDRLVAAFSPYGEPATTTEYRTGREEAPLKVLCAWNACTVRTEDLAKGWLAARFSAQQLEEALAVFRNAISGEPLPSVLKLRVGPPVPHPLDPRVEYQREEAAILSGLLARSLAEGEERGVATAEPVIYAFVGSAARWRDLVPPERAAGAATDLLTPAILFPGAMAALDDLLASTTEPDPSCRFEARLLDAGFSGGEAASPIQWDLEGTIAATAEGSLAALVSPSKNAVLALGEVEDATLFIEPPASSAWSRIELEECVLVVFTNPSDD